MGNLFKTKKMGSGDSKPKQIDIKPSDLAIKAKYLSHELELRIDKLVNHVMREEKKVLTKYGEQKRTINDTLFKDELQMTVVEVHRIKAIKKAILFLRFIETASM